MVSHKISRIFVKCIQRNPISLLCYSRYPPSPYHTILDQTPMDIVEIPKDRINDIEPLWLELNAHHKEKSVNFKDHFFSFSFSERSKSLLAKEALVIFAARVDSEFVGYCIASSDRVAGEIDSLYIKPQFQGASLGARLTEAAMSWLSERGCSQITVAVADGNEAAIPFYEKFGFRKRFHILQIKNSHQESEAC